MRYHRTSEDFRGDMTITAIVYGVMALLAAALWFFTGQSGALIALPIALAIHVGIWSLLDHTGGPYWR